MVVDEGVCLDCGNRIQTHAIPNCTPTRRSDLPWCNVDREVVVGVAATRMTLRICQSVLTGVRAYPRLGKAVENLV